MGTKSKQSTKSEQPPESKKSTISKRSTTSKPGSGPKITEVQEGSPKPFAFEYVPVSDEKTYNDCYEKSILRNTQLHLVYNKDKVLVGLRCPLYVYNWSVHGVLPPEHPKPDPELENSLREAIVLRFPKIPPEEATQVAKFALADPDRVGHATQHSLDTRAEFAVEAWVRHKKTDYESLLRSGMDRKKALLIIRPQWQQQLAEWRGPRTRKEPGARPRNAATDKVTKEAKAKAALVQAIRTLKALVGDPDHTPGGRSRSRRAALPSSTLAAAATTGRYNTRRRAKLAARAAAQQRITETPAPVTAPGYVDSFDEDVGAFYDDDDDVSMLDDLEDWYSDWSGASGFTE
ncbi:hypothetical protein B0J18DRAFT_201993 [Chaetomium sp. MPI-SDFR-AT-0129]|nr:hypothetical protein B0J18DRAFT_201993 [Chaetomium sp. MPI-SDFR-AT-0129]